MAPAARIWREGSSLISRLRDYYFGKKIVETPPAIYPRTAFLCAFIFTLLLISPFYLSRTLRTSPLHSRDSPTVIKARIRAVLLTTTLSTLITIYILIIYGHAQPHEILRLFGLYPFNPLSTLSVLLLTATLFLGPLYESLLINATYRECTPLGFKRAYFDSWTGWRNNIVAPLTEEFVFRSLVIALCILARVSPARIVFLTPLVFGAAHVHHFVEFVQSRTPASKRWPDWRVVGVGLVRSLFQFAFTSVFGFFAAFVYLRTGSLWAVVVAHSFCNALGFPRVWGRVGQEEVVRVMQTTPDVAQGKRGDGLEGRVRVGNGVMVNGDGEGEKVVSRNWGIGWTVGYYVLLVVGAVAFWKLLWPLTESANALAEFK